VLTMQLRYLIFDSSDLLIDSKDLRVKLLRKSFKTIFRLQRSERVRERSREGDRDRERDPGPVFSI
jgi:hypothetical protein